MGKKLGPIHGTSLVLHFTRWTPGEGSLEHFWKVCVLHRFSKVGSMEQIFWFETSRVLRTNVC